MAVRTDQVQVQVEINGQRAGTTLKELENNARQLRRELRQLPVDSQEFADKADELRKVNTQIRQIGESVRGVDRNLQASTQQVGFWRSALSSAAGIFTGMFTLQAISGAIQGVASLFRAGYEGAAEAAANTAQLEAVINSTGGAAGIAREDIDAMARSLRESTNIDDEAIRKSSAVLLTFTNVTSETFGRAQQAILDVSVALGQDLQSSTTQVGKALNDPVRGINALQKVGVSFTESQKAMVKELVATNDVAGAQAIILSELEKEFGGVAAAVGKTEGGPLQKFKLVWDDITEALAEKVIPIFNNLISFVTDIFQKSEPVVAVYNSIFKIFGQVWDQVKQLLASFGLFSSRVDGASVVVKVLTVVANSLTFPLRIVSTLLRELVSALNLVIAVGNGVLNAITVVFTGIRDIAVSTFSGLADMVAGALTFDADQIQRGLDTTRGAFSNFGKEVAAAYNQGFTEVRNRQRAALVVEEEKDAATDKALAKRRSAETAAVESEEQRKAREKSHQDALRAKTELRNKLLELDNQVRQAEVEAMADGIEKDRAREEARFALQTQAISRQIAELRRLGASETEISAVSLRLTEAEYDKHVAELAKITEKYRKEEEEKAKKTAEEEKKRVETQQKAREEQHQRNADADDLFFDNLLLANQNRTAVLLENDRITAGERTRILEESRIAQELIEQQRIEALKRLNEEFGKTTVEQDLALSQRRLDQAQRTTELRLKNEDILRQSLRDSFQFGIEMLSRDEDARRENAVLIKAFTIGSIIIDTEREVAGYFANPGSTASFGIAGALRAAIAIARAAFSVAKVASTEFFDGGYTISDPSNSRIAGIVHANEWVAPSWMTQHPQFSRVIHALEGVRMKGFALGGFTTTPSNVSLSPSVSDEKLDRLIAAVESWPRVVKGVFSYSELTELLDGGAEVRTRGQMK
ncbi:phage tail length tape measure family protein [Chitinophaga rhizosphaerae]|uniref:phage tail length tape measure family protein n=1 Tax=Chitinophaga rhizosphaerae TaxID=1864947 RepID=UPI000F807ADC|nr:phage tail length tape measure family protein [Chitinophaga rhizosphaerae]